MDKTRDRDVTEELLLQLTECKQLSDITVISLRSKMIPYCLGVLSQCIKMIILYLQHNRIHITDLQSNLGRFGNLQKLDLSFNQIKELPSASCFEQLKNIKVLYLHDNMINQWNDLSKLRGMPSIVHLTLHRNPVA